MTRETKMKNFVEYLNESKKEYNFRLKIAVEPTDEVMDKIEGCLNKYQVKAVSSPKKTPIQSHPMDFQTLRNSEVWIIDFTVDYPVTADRLWHNLRNSCGIPLSHMVVINSDHPEEMAREEAESKDTETYTPLLGSEDELHLTEPVYGDEFVEKFVDQQEKHEVPGPSAEKPITTNDLEQGTTSPVGTNPPPELKSRTIWPWRD